MRRPTRLLETGAALTAGERVFVVAPSANFSFNFIRVAESSTRFLILFGSTGRVRTSDQPVNSSFQQHIPAMSRKRLHDASPRRTSTTTGWRYLLVPRLALTGSSPPASALEANPKSASHVSSHGPSARPHESPRSARWSRLARTPRAVFDAQVAGAMTATCIEEAGGSVAGGIVVPNSGHNGPEAWPQELDPSPCRQGYSARFSCK